MPHRIEDMEPERESSPPYVEEPYEYTPEEIVASIFSELCDAIEDGDLQGVQEAVEDWLELDPTHREKKHLLMFAIRDAIKWGRLPILSYLLYQGVPYHWTHIVQAIRCRAINILEMFLHHGWDINEPENWSNPALMSHALGDEYMTRWFLGNGADPNAECMLDYTPLSVAVVIGSLPIIKLLFDAGGSVNHGQLLLYASYRRLPDRVPVLDYLLRVEGAYGLNSRQHEHRPENWTGLLQYGLGAPLHMAANEGYLDAVEYLLAMGADPRVRDSRGIFAIQYADFNQHEDVVKVLSEWQPTGIPV